MKNKKMIIIIGIVLIAGFLLFKKDLWEKNEELLREQILSIGQSVETIELTDVTPFEWDTIYSFSPYTPKEQIYEIVGYKWDRISETMSEGMNQIVFLKDGKVVCYVYGYPTTIGYSISYFGETLAESATVLKVSDDLTFQVQREGEVVHLIKD
ncbi:hypothetical protein [Bacillus sp. REN16]|uniref:hypothetical protein n=1 Tax=Bacillus sp. REN16 TaxID=2887296 RepID=UPI001E3E279D|nr:hypothetical protein [Bacillus sp. REN16]MCC3357049.1 hypothetical protein [Bacillus sp. REN16]